MENFKKALEHSKFIVKQYNEDISNYIKRAVAFETIGEKELANDAYDSADMKKSDIERHEAIITAIEFYMEHNLQQA